MHRKHLMFTQLPLFLIVFLDTLGTALIIPLLNPLFINPHTSILSFQSTVAERNFLYGLTLGIYSLCMFFGAPILGDLSDKLGRKRILLICLLGSFIGYVLAILSVITHTIFGLLVGRMIAGFTAASLFTAQAAIIDSSSSENKIANIGYVLFAASAGYIIGPLVAGIFSNSHLISWFDMSTPLYLAAILSFINALLLIFTFRETFTPNKLLHLSWLAGLRSFISAFQAANIRYLSISFLCLQLGWAIYFQFIGLFLARAYGFNATSIGIFMAVIGIGFTLAFCYLLQFIVRYFSLQNIARFAIAMMAILLLLMLVLNYPITAWLFAIPLATGLAIAYSTLISLFSNQVNNEKQGWIMGLTGALSAFSFGVTGIFSGILANLTISAPLWLSCIFLAVSFFMLLTKITSEYPN